MLTQFQLWSFKTRKYHFKWFLEPSERTEDLTSILSITDKGGIEIYRDYKYGCGFGPPKNPVDGTPNQSLPFYKMVKEAIAYLRSKKK